MMVFASLTHVSAVHGLGEHASNLTAQQFADGMYWNLCAEPFAAMAIGTAKITVALFMMRIINVKWCLLSPLTTILGVLTPRLGKKTFSGSALSR
jgi:hypothetical protein